MPTSAEVWLARLDAEKDLSKWEEVERAWSDARSSVEGSEEDVERVWLWGLDHYPSDRTDRLRTHEVRDADVSLLLISVLNVITSQLLLQESIRSGCSSNMHETLLMKYGTEHVGAKDAAVAVRRIAAEYLATARVWSAVFSKTGERGFKSTEEQHRVLEEIYELWRQKDGLEATVAWAKWLLNNGRGKEAGTVVVTGERRLKEAERIELEKRWTVVLRDLEN